MNLRVRHPRPAFFSAPHDAWILSTYADVNTALRHPFIGTIGSMRIADADTAGTSHAIDRRATLQTRSPAPLHEWQRELTPLAESLVGALPDRRVDLVAAVAIPWCEALAAMVAGISQEKMDECTAYAKSIFLASAHATDGVPREDSINATRALATLLSSPDPTISSPYAGPGMVQAFVAISQSLPSAMASIWLALLERPEHVVAYRHAPEHRVRTIEELLRIAGPAQAVFRLAHEVVSFGEVTIPAQSHLLLHVATANVDPAVFVEPMSIRLDRTSLPHVALGLGLHHCAGASIVRMALQCVTSVVFGTTRRTVMAAPDQVRVPWIDGFAIDAPLAVWVQFNSETNIDAS